MDNLRSSGRIIDAGNSTTATLGIAGVFTGTWFGTVPFSSVQVLVLTDQDSASLGLEIQMSTDGTNVHHVHNFTVDANTPNGAHFEVSLSGLYYRIKYTNGGVAQTTFNLSSTPARIPAGMHMHPIDYSFDVNHPAQLNRSVIAGIDDLGNSGNVKVTRGTLDIHDADIHNILINRHFIDFDAATENPSVAIAAGDTTVLVADTTGFAVGDDIVIKDAGGDVREHHFLITALVVNTSITVDRPIDKDYTTSATLELVAVDMNVAGTLAAPVIYEIVPPSDEVWHLLRILISITDDTAMDDAKFGGIAALTNGVVLRDNKTDDTTLTIWKSNQDMIEDMYDVTYSSKAPAGSYGLRGRFTFKNSGVAIRLDGALGETLQILIQDDLTGLSTFKIKTQGHPEI
jgi:hypothetical protein